MNDLATFQRELDALETGLPDAPDMARIRRGGRLVRRRRRLVQGVGVAAAATTAVALSLGAARQLPTPSFFGSATNGSAGGEYVTLDAPGWTAVYVSDEPALREVQYQKDGAEVDITEYPASQYASYVADRQDVGDGQSLEVLGLSATTWAYAADDHTAIRSPEGGYFIEVRGTGMDAVSYRSLVAQLALTGASEFAQAMPEGTVTPANHDAAIQRLLQGVDLPPPASPRPTWT